MKIALSLFLLSLLASAIIVSRFGYAISTLTEVVPIDCRSLKTNQLKGNTTTILLDKKKSTGQCLRFATVRISRSAGLGHRFGELVFGMMLSELTNSTYIFDEESFFGRGVHGSYEWFRHFLPLSLTELTLDEFRSTTSSTKVQEIAISWDNVADRKHGECNTFLQATSHSCCKNNQLRNNCMCFSALTGAYDRFLWRIAEAHEYATFQPSIDIYSAMEKIFIIAWHIRTGDIILNKNADYFDVIFSQLVTLLRGIPIQIFFIGENVKSNFFFLETVCGKYSTNCSYPDMTAGDAFYHLVRSDVLLTSGSSFAYAAAMFHRGIVINARAKEGSYGIFELSRHSQLDSNGVIIKPTLPELHHELRTVYIRKIKRKERELG